jgi:hypothetical protein
MGSDDGKRRRAECVGGRLFRVPPPRFLCLTVLIGLFGVYCLLQYLISRRILNFDSLLHRNVLMRRGSRFERCPSTRLAMLDYLGNKMNQHNISWCITYGTLLGAVRSHRVIPWTADVDFGIPDLSDGRVQSVLRNIECFYGNVDPNVFHFWSKAPAVHAIHYGFLNIQSHTVYVDVYGLQKVGGGRVHLVGMDGEGNLPENIIFPIRKKGVLLEGKWYPTPNHPEVLLDAVYGVNWRKPDRLRREGMSTEIRDRINFTAILERENRLKASSRDRKNKR